MANLTATKLNSPSAIMNADENQLRIKSAEIIQRIFRGFLGRCRVLEIERQLLIRDLRDWALGCSKKLTRNPDLQEIKTQGTLHVAILIASMPSLPLRNLPKLSKLKAYRCGIRGIRNELEQKYNSVKFEYARRLQERYYMGKEDKAAFFIEKFNISLRHVVEQDELEKREKLKRKRLELDRRKRRAQANNIVQRIAQEQFDEKIEREDMFREEYRSRRYYAVIEAALSKHQGREREMMTQEDIRMKAIIIQEKKEKRWLEVLKEEIVAVKDSKVAGDQDCGSGGKRFGVSIRERRKRKMEEKLMLENGEGRTGTGMDQGAWWRHGVPPLQRTVAPWGSVDLVIDLDKLTAVTHKYRRALKVPWNKLPDNSETPSLSAGGPSPEKLLWLQATIAADTRNIERKTKLDHQRFLRSKRMASFRKLCAYLIRFQNDHKRITKLRDVWHKDKIKTRLERQAILVEAVAVETRLPIHRENIIASCREILEDCPTEVALFCEAFMAATGDPCCDSPSSLDMTASDWSAEDTVEKTVAVAKKSTQRRQTRIKAAPVSLLKVQAAAKEKEREKELQRQQEKEARLKAREKAAQDRQNMHHGHGSPHRKLVAVVEQPKEYWAEAAKVCSASLLPPLPPVGGSSYYDGRPVKPKPPPPAHDPHDEKSRSKDKAHSGIMVHDFRRRASKREDSSIVKDGKKSKSPYPSRFSNPSSRTSHSQDSNSSHDSHPKHNVEESPADVKTLDVPGLILFLEKDCSAYDFIVYGTAVRKWLRSLAIWFKRHEEQWRMKHRHVCISFFQRFAWMRGIAGLSLPSKASRHDQQREYAPMRCAEESVAESVLLLAKFESCSVIDLYDLLLARSSVVFQAFDPVMERSVKKTICAMTGDRRFARHPASFTGLVLLHKAACYSGILKEDLLVTSSALPVSNTAQEQQHQQQQQSEQQHHRYPSNLLQLLRAINFVVDTREQNCSIEHFLEQAMQEERTQLVDLTEALIAKRFLSTTKEYLCVEGILRLSKPTFEFKHIEACQFVRIEKDLESWNVHIPSWMQPVFKWGQPAGPEPFWRRLLMETRAGLLETEGKYRKMNALDNRLDAAARVLFLGLKKKALRRKCIQDKVFEAHRQKMDREMMVWEDALAVAKRQDLRRQQEAREASRRKAKYGILVGLIDAFASRNGAKVAIAQSQAEAWHLSQLQKPLARQALSIKQVFQVDPVAFEKRERRLLDGTFKFFEDRISGLRRTHSWITGEAVALDATGKHTHLQRNFDSAGLSQDRFEEAWVFGGLYNVVTIYRVVVDATVDPRGVGFVGNLSTAVASASSASSTETTIKELEVSILKTEPAPSKVKRHHVPVKAADTFATTKHHVAQSLTTSATAAVSSAPAVAKGAVGGAAAGGTNTRMTTWAGNSGGAISVKDLQTVLDRPGASTQDARTGYLTSRILCDNGCSRRAVATCLTSTGRALSESAFKSLKVYSPSAELPQVADVQKLFWKEFMANRYNHDMAVIRLQSWARGCVVRQRLKKPASDE